MKSIFIFGLTMILLCNTTFADLNTDLLRVWQFNETSGTTANEILRETEDITIAATYAWIAGKSANALNLTTTVAKNNLAGGTIGNELADPTSNVSLGGWLFVDWGAGTDAPIWVSTNAPASVKGIYTKAYSNGTIYVQYGDGGWHWVYSAPAGITRNTWFHYIMTKTNNERKFYVNGVLVLTYTFTPTSGVTWSIGDAGAGILGKYTVYDEWYMWNRTLPQAEIDSLYNSGAGDYYPFTVPPAGPPNIDDSTWNCSSATENQDAWQTSKDAVINVTDSTPTIRFTTSENADCAIGTTLDNYTTLIAGDSDRNCTTTGSTDQVCTLPVADALTSGIISNLTVGCRDTTGNENTSSTSGFLKINYTSASSPCTPSGSVWVMTESCTLPTNADYSSITAYVPSPYMLTIEANITFQKIILENGGTYAIKR